MVPLIRTKPIDLNRLSNIEQVFGLSLIAIEIVLVGWIYKSTGAFERVGMGVCFVALLAVLVYGVVRVRTQRSQTPTDEIIPAETLRNIEKGATANELKEHSSDEIGGPDGTYKINRPPKSWQIRELSYGDYLREDIEWVYGKAAPFNDERSKDRHNSSFGKVLLLERGNRVTWIPRPGETKLNGRELMSATGDCFQTQVAIFPISRFSQVRAAEASFYSNAVLALTQEAGPTTISMLDLDKGTGGRRPKLLAELRGIIENVYIFERQEVVTVEGHTRFLAVNGDIEDYALVAYDYTIIDKKGNRTESSAEVLNDILNSFRFLVRPTEGREESMEVFIDKKRGELIHKMKDKMFLMEIEIVERKLKPLDLNVGHDIGIALEYLKSLAALSNRLEVNSELARKVRAGAAAGQKGDLAQVKVMVFQIRKEIKEAGQRGGRGAGGQKLRSQGREKENKAEAEAERA